MWAARAPQSSFTMEEKSELKSRLIVMLTNNDRTVENAIEVFDSCSDVAVENWGFKDVGITQQQMKVLVRKMKDAGKITYLEVVSYSEQACRAAAELAVECEFDWLMGTILYPAVFEFLKEKTIKYSPFCGKISGSPSIMEGTIAEIVEDGVGLARMGVDGVDLLAYRYVDGSPEELTREFLREVRIPVVMAGSINSFERIDIVNNLNPWAFTMGSALFEHRFDEDGSFRENLERVVGYMNSGE